VVTIEDFPGDCALTADGDTALVGNRRSLHIRTALSGDICTRVLDRMLLTCAIDNEPSRG
jgi:hypothetical protein